MVHHSQPRAGARGRHDAVYGRGDAQPLPVLGCDAWTQVPLLKCHGLPKTTSPHARRRGVIDDVSLDDGMHFDGIESPDNVRMNFQVRDVDP